MYATLQSTAIHSFGPCLPPPASRRERSYIKSPSHQTPTVRQSFLLPFRGGEIRALEVDALAGHTGLVIEKSNRDIRYAWRPSTTSRVAILLRDTRPSAALLAAIVEGLVESRGGIQKAAFIGMASGYRRQLSEMLRRETHGIGFRFFSDCEKAKKWLVP